MYILKRAKVYIKSLTFINIFQKWRIRFIILNKPKSAEYIPNQIRQARENVKYFRKNCNILSSFVENKPFPKKLC